MCKCNKSHVTDQDRKRAKNNVWGLLIIGLASGFNPLIYMGMAYFDAKSKEGLEETTPKARVSAPKGLTVWRIFMALCVTCIAFLGVALWC